MTIHIGYTGTQRGMTSIQCEVVRNLVRYKDFYAHHGDCVGGDAQFDEIVRRAPGCRGVIVHPPKNPSKRAFVQIRHPYDTLLEEKDYLDRNKDIVDAIERANQEAGVGIPPMMTMFSFVIAGPGEPQMQTRSGTWSTYRYARSKRMPTYLIHPNGVEFYEAT